MIITDGHQLVDAAQRDAVVERFTSLVSRAREFDGCIHFAITADSVDPERINVSEVWQDAATLDAWRGQADAPDADEIKHVDVKRYNAKDGGPLF